MGTKLTLVTTSNGKQLTTTVAKFLIWTLDDFPPSDVGGWKKN